MILLSGNVQLYDNSSLMTWRERGPRYWYFRHYRNWIRQPQDRGDRQPTIPAFLNGLAWHEMMDYYWAHPEEGWEPAWEIYQRYWYEHGLAGGFPLDDLDPDFEHSLQPFAPSTVMSILIAYDELRRPLLKDIDLIRPERPFIVKLDPENSKIFYMGRMDKVFRYQRQLVVADHKTTGSYYVRPLGRPHLRPYWKDGWRVKTQPKGYLYAIKEEFGPQPTTIWIDGTLFHPDPPTNEFFCIEPIDCQTAALDAWLWGTHNTIREIQQHIETVEGLRASGKAEGLPYLPAFPCFGCSSHCPYSGLCQQRDNPESWLAEEEIPEGFERQQWAPFSVEEMKIALGDLEKAT